MQATVAEYVHVRGVDVAAVEWTVSGPATRPSCHDYVIEVPEAFCSVRH
jgi:hypothetical protein